MIKQNSTLDDNDGKIKINPYNCNNILITKEDIQNIFSIVDYEDYKIKNIEYFRLAFSHKSYCKKKNNSNDIELAEKPDNALELREISNERLEYLGDSIISPIIANYLYDRFQSQDEGFLTRMRTKLVNGEALGDFASKLGFEPFLILSRHVEERCNGRNNYRILEDAFESFIGAIYLDANEQSLREYSNSVLQNKNVKIISRLKKTIKSVKCESVKKKLLKDVKLLEKELDIDEDISGIGFQICQKFIINLIETFVDFAELILKDTNYKDQLLRYFQHNFQTTPKYSETKIEGPAHDRKFTMSVVNPKGHIIGTGTGKSKKKAEQKASKFALIYLGELECDVLTDDSSTD